MTIARILSLVQRIILLVAENLMQSVEFNGQNKVHVGDGSGLSIKHVVQSSFVSPYCSKALFLKNLLHVPQINKNLLSVSRFAKDNNVFFEFHPCICFVKDQATKTTLMTGKVKDGLYSFTLPMLFKTAQLLSHSSKSVPKSAALHSFVPVASSSNYTSTPLALQSNCTQTTSVLDVWHRRLGNPSIKVLRNVLFASNIPVSNKTELSFCSSCCLGKINKLPYFSFETEYTAPLQLIHSDLWGSGLITSTSGYHYYIHFIDAYSRYTWIYLLTNKSDAIQTFLNFKSQVELQFNTKIKSLQTNWVGEYRSFQQLLQSYGIIHRVSCPRAHEQNGLAERKHRHIVDNGLTLLTNAFLSLKYWDEAFRTTVYLINRLPTAVLSMKTL